MSNTITYENTTLGNLQVTYANDELAFITGDYIASCPLHSTAISWWKYETKTNELVVKYKSSETYYYYVGVPFSAMFALMSADSLGAFIAKEIKPNFSIA
jgi:hypothetical protein